MQGIVGFFEEKGSRVERIVVADESNIHFRPPVKQHAYLPKIFWASNSAV